MNPESLVEKFAKESIKKMISNMTGNRLNGIIDKILWSSVDIINLYYYWLSCKKVAIIQILNSFKR